WVESDVLSDIAKLERLTGAVHPVLFTKWTEALLLPLSAVRVAVMSLASTAFQNSSTVSSEPLAQFGFPFALVCGTSHRPLRGGNGERNKALKTRPAVSTRRRAIGEGGRKRKIIAGEKKGGRLT